MSITETEWDLATRGSAVRRSRREGFLRNVAVALGNSRPRGAVAALAKALRDEAPLVRGHAAWALGRIADEDALQALRERLPLEHDPWVVEELELAMAAPSSTGNDPKH